jgi:hypothetical protein
MRAPALAVALLLPAGALAQPACPDAEATRPTRQALLAQEDGLGVALAGPGLLLLALSGGSKLSAEAGILVTFLDGTECAARVPGGDAPALRLALPAARVAAVEAGVCDAADGSCVPARVTLPRR